MPNICLPSGVPIPTTRYGVLQYHLVNMLREAYVLAILRTCVVLWVRMRLVQSMPLCLAAAI